MAVAHGLSGRIEKRLPIAMVVHLARTPEDPGNTAELTYTENLSAHGACVVSRCPWRRGDLAVVTSFTERTALRGKVVSCRKRGQQYAVGLTFLDGEVPWSTFRSYAGR